jgi:hypothetical protein
MKLTPAIRKSINYAVRVLCRGRRHCEVGERSWTGRPIGDGGMNMLTWGPGHDLFQTYRLGEINKVSDRNGWVALDIYCYTGGDFGRDDRELDRNVYILLNPKGEIVYASEDDHGHVAAIDEILEKAGEPPFTKGYDE